MAINRSQRKERRSWGARVFSQNIDFFLKILRVCFPIFRVKLKGTAYYAVTRFDDVREVMSLPNVFQVPYTEKLRVIMGGDNFFLGMNDEPEYTRQTTAMRMTLPRDEANADMLAHISSLSQEVIDAANGRIDVVMDLTQKVTTRFLCQYFGTPHADEEYLSAQAQLLFDFQFADFADDPELRQQAEPAAQEMRDFVERTIATRKSNRNVSDDVLERCLKLQDQDFAGVSDRDIRNNLIGFLIGGLPQPPMVIPQLVDVLLSKPDELARAQQAARDNDDKMFSGYLFEALRFHPLTPGLFRICTEDYKLAADTNHTRVIPKGATVFASTRAAMFDGRRVKSPARFIAGRPWHAYMNFGYGMHECFGRYMNRQLIPGICKPLFRQGRLRRAPGAEGRLQKEGIFASSLHVEFSR